MPHDAPTWLERVYSHVKRGETDDAIDLVFQNINALLMKKQFARCDNLLRAVDINRLDIDLMIGVLSITLRAAAKLPYRAALLARVRARLTREVPARVERLLIGLG